MPFSVQPSLEVDAVSQFRFTLHTAIKSAFPDVPLHTNPGPLRSLAIGYDSRRWRNELDQSATLFNARD